MTKPLLVCSGGSKSLRPESTYPPKETSAVSHPGVRRLDIDLLRCLAVLAVVFFHFGIPGFSGGFIGVDIFFVISGYLITKQLRKNIRAGTFSYAEFLARRARRLVPAYAVSLLLTGGLGVFILAPDSHVHLQKELQFSAAYLSNFAFWHESGYFDTAAITKPLLHTWSLSVEEQFYLFWPALLLLFSKGRATLWWSSLGIVSLIACEMAIGADASAAFFLFPFRIFEFVIGALIPKARLPESRKARRILDILALLALTAPIFLLTERSHFPGTAVLPPCLGTAWLIAARPGWMNQIHLFSRIGSWIGKVSYSAYLVHWPLVVYCSQYYGEDFNALTTTWLLVATAILSGFMWKFIEQPFLESQIRVRAFLPAVPATFLIVLATTQISPWIYERVHADRSALNLLVSEIEPRKKMTERFRKEDRWGAPDATPISVVGDSHCVDGAFALKSAAGDSVSLKLVHTVCDPLVNSFTKDQLLKLYADSGDQEATADKCMKIHNSLMGMITHIRPKLIVFSERWREAALPYLAESIQRIHQETEATVVILGKNQEFDETPGRLLRHVSSPSQIRRAAWEHRVDETALNEKLREISESQGAVFIDKTLLVCPVKGSCDYYASNALTYSDVSHWTEPGIDLFGQRLVEKMFELGLLERHHDATGSPRTEREKP